MVRRLSIFGYGVVSYGMFFATFLYTIGFVGGFGVPRIIDGPLEGSLAGAIAVDLGLLGLFALQHSVMARQGFKRRLTRIVPEAAERSTYVLGVERRAAAPFLAVAADRRRRMELRELRRAGRRVRRLRDRLAARVLGDTDHDRNASALRGRHDGVHPDRDSVRGARSGGSVRRVLRRVSRARTDARPSPAAVRGRTGPRPSHRLTRAS